MLEDPSTTGQWVDVSILIMTTSCELGAKVYPLIMAIGIFKALIKYV
jgi:hypothetical protein